MEILTWNDIIEEANNNNIEACLIAAVIAKETGSWNGGSGFLKSGKPKILFEGHVFWKELKKFNIDPNKINSTNKSNILYEKWTKQHYLGGEKEYLRLEEAKKIHEEAALSSASWGMFQIMGNNYKSCGYNNVFDFVNNINKSEKFHLQAFINFIKSNNLLNKLKNKDWAGFAKGYNGSAYLSNQYDTKLKSLYDKCINDKK